MPDQLQLRGGTTAQHASFTGVSKEVTVDTTKKTAVVHDGSTAGGNPLLREDGSNSALALGSQGTPSLKFTGDTNTGIYSPGADQVAISTGGSGRLFISSAGEVTSANEKLNLITVGRGAGSNSTNTAIGASALSANTTGSQNTAAGNLALTTNTTGQYNTAFGVAALNTNNGNDNTAVGRVALYFNSSGGSNVAVGHQALYNNTTGSNNVCIGVNAGSDLTTGSGNTIIGNVAGTAGLNNTIILGAGSTERLRIDSSGRVGIGTSAPASRCEIDSTGGAASATGATTAANASIAIASVNGLGTQTKLYAGVGSSDYVWLQAQNVNTTRNICLNPVGGSVGIGTTSPGTPLNVQGIIRAQRSDDPLPTNIRSAQIGCEGSEGSLDTVSNGGTHLAIRFRQSSDGSTFSERARIDASGRLLVGTSSARSAFGVTSNLQAEGTDYDGGSINLIVNNNSGAGNSSFINLCRSRGITKGSNTVVQADDSLGAIAWCGADGSDLTSSAASIRAFVDGTPGADDMPGRIVLSTTSDGASSPTERMRIKSTGEVEIGTNVTPTGLALNLYSNSNVDNYGTLLCGNANTTAAACVAAFYTATNSTATSNVLIKFGIDNYASGSGQINANGASAAAFGTFSDARLKENIEDLPSQWDNIKSLRPVEFDYVESFGGGHQIGFIAQEMQSVYPDVVGIGENEMLTVTAWSKTEARLVKALQEALERIESLEAEVAALKAQ